MALLKEKREFITKQKIKGGISGIEIVVDAETGVNYIYTGYAFTPLLNAEGKPIIDKLD